MNIFLMKIRKFTIPVQPIDWQRLLKESPASSLASVVRKLVHLRDGGLTRGWFTVSYRFARLVRLLWKHQGARGTATYLKVCSVLLQQYAGNQRLLSTRSLGCAVTRTRRGLPRVIPLNQRRLIDAGDSWTVRLWTSFFWLYRVIEYPGKVNLKTITKVGPWRPEDLYEFALFTRNFLPEFLGKTSPSSLGDWNNSVGMANPPKEWSTRFAENTDNLITKAARIAQLCGDMFPTPMLGWRGLPISLPTFSKIILKSSPSSGQPEDSVSKRTITSIGSCLTDWLVLNEDPEGQTLLEHITGLYNSIKKLSVPLGGSTPDESNFNLFRQKADAAIQALSGIKPSRREDYHFLTKDGKSALGGFGASRGLGYLGFKQEPSGKVRVFAMVDNLSQTMLAPLHDSMFKLLKAIPQDGTFNQQAPAQKLMAKGFRRLWSYDLSAATDRFPADLIQIVVGALFSSGVGNAWRLVLTDRPFRTPISHKLGVHRAQTLWYGAGQPMGALTSWAAFALTHHFLVQQSAFKATGIMQWFEDYALLGDDIVIADEKVAEYYAQSLKEWGVEIGIAKSLISDNGTFEFAKQTWRSGTNLSGISLKALGQAVADPGVLESLLEIAEVRGIKNALRVSASILGYGFKAKARLPAVLKSKTRLQGLAILLTRPRAVYGLTPNEWFLQVLVGRPVILSSSQMARVVEAVQQSLLASLAKAMEGLESFYLTGGKHNINVGEGVTPTHWHEDIFPLGEFLSDYVMMPFIRPLRKEIFELRETYTETLEAIGPETNLNDSYLMVTDLMERISSFSQDLDIITRKPHEDVKTSSSTRVIIRSRSRAVKLWRGVHKVVVKAIAQG